MCGICGIIRSHRENPVAPVALKKMTNSLIHRGPDDAGFYVNGNVGLAMRRLQVIDLETGQQPVFNEDKSVAVVQNGEIYNYLELRERLIQKGHRFYTKSDTEVIVHLYEEYGEDFLQHLNGMFAIALWDGATQKLILARDRLGEKPLYYFQNDSGIAFASELKALAVLPDFPREINHEAIYHYFSFLVVSAPKTMYRGVKKLRPAHYLRFQNGRTEIRRYWDVRFDPQHHWSEEMACEQLKELLIRSIRQRIRSDVPFGAFLSGGIDSSIVVALMSEVLDEPVKTFSIGFEEDRYNELNYARQIADKYHTEHHELVVKPSAIDLLDKLVWHFDEPFAGPSAIPTYIVSKMAREHVTVVLTGDGGDEVFLGYGRYLEMLERQKYNRIPAPLRKLLGGVGGLLPQRAYGKGLLQSLGQDDFHYYTVGLSQFFKPKLFTRDFLQQLSGVDSFSVVSDALLDDSHEYLTRLNALDMKHYLPENVLVKVDRMSMANSLETRALFLDHEIVEFAAKIPTHLKIKNGVTKYILKQSVRDLLPPEIVNRGKWGFALPVDEWFRGELREMIREKIDAVQKSEMFNHTYLSAILDEHTSRRRDHSYLLWSFLMLQKWFDAFTSTEANERFSANGTSQSAQFQTVKRPDQIAR